MPVVFSSFFGIEDENLVHIEGRLCEIVVFYRAGKGYMRVIEPNLSRIERSSRKVAVNILKEDEAFSDDYF